MRGKEEGRRRRRKRKKKKARKKRGRRGGGEGRNVGAGRRHLKKNLREARKRRKPESIMKPMGRQSFKRKELSKVLKTSEK